MSAYGSVLIIGAGGLGSGAALTLASAGVSRLVLVDGARVEPADLGRAALLRHADVGAPRASAGAARLRELFPALEVAARDVALDAGNVLQHMRGVAVALAGSESLATQFLAGDAALRVGVPLVVGGVLRTTVQLMTVRPSGWGGCLRCLFEAPPEAGTVPTASQVGVLGPVAVLGGALMGAEALRVLTAEHGAYEGRLLSYDARSARARVVAVPRRADCPACAGAQALEPRGVEGAG